MFGGHGIYADGLIFAVEIRGELYLKGDTETSAALEQAGARRWTYTHAKKPGSIVAMPFWLMPADAMDDPDDLRRWCREALAAARRLKTSARKQPAKKPKAGSRKARVGAKRPTRSAPPKPAL